MSLLSQASLVVVPSGYKEDVVYSVKPTDGSGDLTFTRASDATRVNSAGLVERVPWNLLQQSNTFSTTWSLTSVSATGGQAGYDGTNDAWLIDIIVGTSSQRLNQTISASGILTLSVYAKAGTLGWMSLRGDAPAVSEAYFNLATGELGSLVGAAIDSSIESVGSGWYRCSVSFLNTTIVRIYLASGNGNINQSSGNIYIQDAQLVEGSTAKPYFPTTDRLNVPRLDYSNGCPSLLLEPQRTNLVTYSEQFDNAAWVKLRGSITANNTSSPSGYLDADLFIPDTTNNNHTIFTSITSGQRTFSVFAKSSGYNYIFLGVNNNAASDGVFFDLSNGTISQNTSGLVANITSFGNGWYRCDAYSNTWGTLAVICTSQNGTSFVHTGNGTSGIFVWGAQVEAGSYPTSYIPTTSASVTRVADAAYKTGISSLIGQTEGTMFAEFEWDGIDKDRMFIALTDGTSSNRMHCGYDETNNRFYFNLRSGNVQQALIVLNNPSVGRYKIAGAYKQNDVTFYINGTQIGTDSSTLVAATSQLNVGGYITSGFEYPVNQAVLFKTRLSNTDLASLTTL